MRPAEPLSANLRGVTLAEPLDVPRAFALLAHGTRQERRAALRWLQRHRDLLTNLEAALCRLKSRS